MGLFTSKAWDDTNTRRETLKQQVAKAKADADAKKGRGR